MRNPKINQVFFEFLDRNRIILSQYFSEQVSTINPDLIYFHQANFINAVRRIPKIFNILKKIYLGSIIASYLEADYGKPTRELEFVLDTNFIISILNLDSPESTHTCLKIIEICKRLGYRLTVLDITIEETTALLRRTAQNFETMFLVKQVDPESIYSACERRSLTRTDLEIIAERLPTTLFEEHAIKVIPNTTKYRNEAKYSKEYKVLKGLRFHKLGAHHDATVIKYVQNKRGKRVNSFYEANCWFVTNTKK